MLHPREVTGTAPTKVSAWVCPDRAKPLGQDAEPRTKDDTCRPVIANWRLRRPDAATLSRDRGHTVLVRMTNPIENTLVASRGQEQEKRARLVP